MKQNTVLITGAGGRSLGSQIISCLKRFPQLYRIIATDQDPFSSGLFIADKAYLVPAYSDKKYIPRLIEIAKKENVCAIFPGSQPELVSIALARELLVKNNIIPMINKPELITTFSNKATQYQYLTNKGIRIPKFLLVSGNLPKKLSFRFPLILKPTKEHAGSRNVYIIKDMKELKIIYNQVHAEGIELLIQEYCGDSEHEYTVGVISDKEGNVIDAIVLKRKLIGLSLLSERHINNKNYAISTGYSQGFFVEDKIIKKFCMDVAKKIDSKGPLNIQLRTDKEGPVIFEIHARFSGSCSQRAAVGFNEPDLLFRNFLLNEKMTPQKKLKQSVSFRYLADISFPTSQYKLLSKGRQ